MQQAEIDLQVMLARQGNRTAFASLVKHFNPAAMRFAYRVCADAELARDATQEAWLEVARSMRRLQDPRGFRSWLFRLVRWRVLDQVRKERKHRNNRAEMQPDELPDESCKNTAPSLAGWIHRLPELERQAIHLYYLEELSVAEIALVLEVPTGTVKSRLHRARQHLKRLLESDYGTLNIND